MTDQYNDLSQEEILKMMKDLIDKGNQVFIKWTCENCGERVTSNTPNVFYSEGWKHEDCGFTSFPNKFGLLLMGRV